MRDDGRDDAIMLTDREEVESLRILNDDLRERLEDSEGRSNAAAAAAVSFAIAGSSCALAMGLGGLGVVFVSGMVAGVFSLIRATKSRF